MELRTRVQAEFRVVGPTVRIELQGPTHGVTWAFSNIAMILEDLKVAGVVKWYRSAVSEFIVMPHWNWNPIELETEVKRRLQL